MATLGAGLLARIPSLRAGTRSRLRLTDSRTARGPEFSEPTAIDELVLANRILANLGVMDAFGHVSIRDPLHPERYFISRALAPALVTAKDIVCLNLDSEPADKAARNAKLYLERYIHGEIYKARRDVMAVVHTHSPKVVAFGVSDVALMPVHLNAAFLGDSVPVFEIRDHFGSHTDLLISTAARGKALAATLGNHAVALMRGHGDAVIGESLRVAVWNAYYTHVNAGELLHAISLGGRVTYLSAGETKLLSEGDVKVVDRPWEEWVRQLSS